MLQNSKKAKFRCERDLDNLRHSKGTNSMQFLIVFEMVTNNLKMLESVIKSFVPDKNTTYYRRCKSRDQANTRAMSTKTCSRFHY